ncbi:trafficking kinesin-binding protein milt isoform X2 [Chrysoperla carnea]|uniref:trafficking kinesin-binding protein milt isoform X2 n=1 Tax=Chrysoperla carnea TaxID=189513 RepID=UPI001D05CAD8|nr:trafficking kinesin-binding protein milt isoform X2 [Chrysoperla carnea]
MTSLSSSSSLSSPYYDEDDVNDFDWWIVSKRHRNLRKFQSYQESDFQYSSDINHWLELANPDLKLSLKNNCDPQEHQTSQSFHHIHRRFLTASSASELFGANTSLASSVLDQSELDSVGGTKIDTETEVDDDFEDVSEFDDPYEYDEEISTDYSVASSSAKPKSLDEEILLEVLCSNRVSQMTKTYNDIEAVTRLLEEKERDLELTARIGKELLQTNTKLENNVVTLETELRGAQEKITQLSHELVKKTELIQVLTNDMDESSSEGGTPTGLRSINLELMQKRIGNLEEENRSLRTEFQKLASDTDDVEEQEARLVKDIAMQLANANMDVDTMAEELDRMKDENRLQHEQIMSLTAKLTDAEMRLHKFTMENDEMTSLLHITKETQTSLATELVEYKERYAEVLGLLRDTQEQLRRQRRRGMPTARGGSLYPSLCSNQIQPDSLQSELESSLYSESSLDSGIAGSDRVPPYKRVFETVRCSSRASNSSFDGGSTLGGPTGIGGAGLFPRGGPLPLSTQTHMTSSITSQQPRMSTFMQGSRYSSMSFGSSSLGYPSIDSTGQSDSESLHTDTSSEYPGGTQPGIPGIPGAADLEAAVRRLTPAEVLARRATLSSGQTYGGYDNDSGVQSPPSQFLPFGYRTPDSIMSTGSNREQHHHLLHSNSTWKLPEKLQIVKPMEGSQTLHHWSKLATPTLGGLLDERPGVKIRGERALEDIGLETYTLSDLEEDEEYSNPGKQFENSGCVYTYTMSTVLHPDEVASVTDSVRGSRVASVCPSEHGSPPSTPRILSRRNSTSTFSTTLGLAKILNERGIKAVTPSCLNTPNAINSFTPTATPCNSPDGTPPPSRSASPPPYLGILSSGVELIRRTFGGVDPAAVRASRRSKRSSKLALSRTDRKALSGIRIVEKIERIGLESILASTAQTTSPTFMNSIYTQRPANTQLAQLSTIKGSISSTSASSEYSDSSSSSDLLKEKPPLHGSSTSSNKSSSTSSQTNRERMSLSRERTPLSALGLPAKPGSGQLQRRLEQLNARQARRQAGGLTRPDLGTVGPPNGPKSSTSSRQDQQNRQQQPQQSLGTLGTINSLLFGRKGGLL